MFTAKVYRVMVGSLSGAMEEVYVAKETIRKWNLQNAELTGKLFMPIEWASESEVIQNVDVVVAVVDNWVEEEKVIEDCLDGGKQVALFFNSVHEATNTISGELEDVRLFRDRVRAQSFSASYHSKTELVNQLNERLFIL